MGPDRRAIGQVPIEFWDRRTSDAAKVRLEGMVSDLSKTRNNLQQQVQAKSDELKVKNGQLKNGISREEKSEEKVRVLTLAVESSSDGIFIIDARKQGYPVIYANQAFQTMTGYEKREIIGQDYFSLYGPGADRRVIDEIKLTMRSGKSFHGEMFNFQKSGKKYWDLLRIAPMRDAGGAATHYIGIQTDVTLIRERELEIEEQREEILHVTRVGKLAEFVSSLAHEINQPLTAILSYAQAAQRMLAGREPELRKIMSYIIQDDQRAAGVIQRMRSLLKKTASEMKPIDINALINETMILIATDATVRSVLLRLELENRLPLVRGDRIQLQQVLLNLISNSFDAMEKNTGSREITIHAEQKDTDTLMVSVKDTGSGIAAHNMAKMFTHFFTSKPDGLGMGLSISRSIVESHGGRITVQNNPDRGVTFSFTIPVDKKDK